MPTTIPKMNRKMSFFFKTFNMFGAQIIDWSVLLQKSSKYCFLNNATPPNCGNPLKAYNTKSFRKLYDGGS